MNVNAPNVNPTPKQRFQESADNVTKHREMIQDRAFQRGIDTALLEYQSFVSQEVSNNPGSAAFAGLKMNGAMEFVTILKLLGEQAQRVTPKLVTPNLDHNQ